MSGIETGTALLLTSLAASTAVSGATSAFSAMKQKKPPSVLTGERKDEEAAREAARREAERIKRRRGYSSTIATGPLGVTEQPTITKTQLGG